MQVAVEVIQGSDSVKRYLFCNSADYVEESILKNRSRRFKVVSSSKAHSLPNQKPSMSESMFQADV